MNGQSKIELVNVSKIYYTEDIETHALKDINLKIFDGDFLSISGQSGCGKSTLLSILGLLDTATKGQYLINGKDVSTLKVDERADIRNQKLGFIFQSFNLIDELSVFDNIAMPLRYRIPAMDIKDINRRVNDCLELVQMSHRLKHTPNRLSGGQQQRVAIARALVGNPELLLVDEPTGNLDSKNGDIIMDMLAELNQQGTTICMVTHDPRYADMAKTKLQLVDGELQGSHNRTDNKIGTIKSAKVMEAGEAI